MILVGPTGAGKTSARRILEKALIILPVAANLSLKERQSDSKVNLLNESFHLCIAYTSVHISILSTFES